MNIQDVISELAEKNGSKSLFEPVKEQLGMAGEGDGKAQPEDEEVPLGRASADSAISNTGIIRTFHKKSGYDDMLSQDFDGQISLVVPEEEKIEKQITGQLSIEDIMAEWEKMKQENERKRMEDIRKRVHQQTDTLFADFDEATKSGLLEELEKVMVSAAIKEEKRRAAKERPKVVKAADMDKKAKEDDSTASEDAIKKRLLKEAVENAKDFEDFENKLNPLVAKILEADDEEAEVSAEESMDESLEKYPETDRILENSEEDSEEEYETEVNDLVEDVNEKDGAAADSISDNIDGEAEDTPDTENVRKKVPKGSLNLKGTKKVSAKAGESKAKGSKEKKEEKPISSKSVDYSSLL